MAVKQWNTGDVLTAADLNSWTVPLVGIKSADQTISSQTTFVNDADLRVSMAATATYEYRAYLRYDSPAGGDFKISMSVPAGANTFYEVIRQNLGNTFGSNVDQQASDNISCLGSGAGTIINAVMTGICFTTGTSGNLIVQWAQNTSNAGNTTLRQRSYITARRIG